MDRRAFGLTASGFGLIAVCYGLARFAFGLFLPAIAVDLSLSASFSGLISGGSFFGYCLAIVVSAALTERFGPRFVAGLAGCVATIGILGIASAPGGVTLAAAVLFAGMSTGLASPPLAAAVSQRVVTNLQDRANTLINAGASGGVALSAPAALILGSDWRLAFAIFVGVALIETVIIILITPRAATGSGDHPRGLPALNDDVKRLFAAAFLMGAASTAVWSFGGELTRRSLGWSSAEIGTLWLAIGLVGLTGGACGHFIQRFGLNRVQGSFLLVLAAATILVAMAQNTVMALVGGGLFGVAYMALTGVYLVWGIRAMQERPATGITIGFLAIAAGQVAGAPIFGLLLDTANAPIAGIAFALVALSACALPRHLGTARPAS
ncbi:MFS transporter [Chelativorans sp. M5D2P16]|uniref:MFS transporter n=1 Tax=Chelativorans sp. M5D2P16 TaxID=3095678 RepID=UPI002ACA2357|nr:MFS transporter [Chelativorans sp. M5D2P16]MDZ5696114.1 MFS transporter [Chelativorans sp. M5D2P16]